MEVTRILEAIIPTFLAFIGGILTVTWSEKRKSLQNRAALCLVLQNELVLLMRSIADLESVDTNDVDFSAPLRSKTAWALLNSDMFSFTEDKEIIEYTHNYVGFCENYNTLNHLLNLSYICSNKSAKNDIYGGMCELRVEMKDTIENMLRLLPQYQDPSLSFVSYLRFFPWN